VSSSDIAQAQTIVNDAVAAQGVYNAYRVAHPQRNRYISRNSPEARAAKNKKRDDEPAAPTLNATVLAAAALLAEHQAANRYSNGTLHRKYPQPKTLRGFTTTEDEATQQKRDGPIPYWVAEIAHTGHAPMGSDNSYPVNLSLSFV